MMYPTTENEALRLGTLRRLNILNTEPEERFDCVTELITDALGLNIALVSLVDEKHQWFKSKQGIDVCQTDRDISFCTHAITKSEPFIISDATRDDRFKTNPLVTQSPNIRSYLGIPLTMPNGSNVGTLCAIDTKPRNFTDGDIRIMKNLAAIVLEELSKEKLSQTIKNLEEKTASLQMHERELQLARQQSEEANRLKSEFLAMMSHEIRTPLNGVSGFLAELKHTKLSGDQSEFLNLASESCDLLLSVINDVLDFSKIEAGQLDLEIIPARLDELLNQVLAMFKHSAKTKGLVLDLSLPKEIEAKVFKMDPHRLKQILYNLLTNAIKFTDAGKVGISISQLSINKDGSANLSISVRDSGLGISKEKQKLLFKPFSQMEASTSRKYGGSGLGLVICQRLAHKMEGKIEVESELGKGSIFTLKVKFEGSTIDELERLTAQNSEENKIQPPSKDYSLIKILAADDNKINARLLEVVCKRLKVNVKMVTSGIELLKEVEKDAFDLILMDIEMPDLDGFETTSRLRSSKTHIANIPVVALSAHIGEDFRQRCLNAGMVDVLTKPFRAGNLRQIIAAHL